MDINQSILEEETKSPIDSSFEEELFSEESSCDNLSCPLKEFHFLNASTYFSLYPDIFNRDVMHSPYSYDCDFTLSQSYEVQYNHDFHLENKEINLSSHETFHPLSTWELGNIQTTRFEEVSYDSSKLLDQWSYHDHSLYLFHIDIQTEVTDHDKIIDLRISMNHKRLLEKCFI